MKDDFDAFSFSDYYKLQSEERALKRAATEESLRNESKKKKFRPRKSYRKRDPKMSNWWTDYVIDEKGTFSDISHRDGRLFAYRFSFSLITVRELVSKIKEKEENFWKRKYDAAGREASPIDLLVLGSLRILTRNVTLDDLYEQTFISSEVHRIFFTNSCTGTAHGFFRR